MSHSAGVVLLHGLARTSRSFRKMERALQGAGFLTLNLDYASRKRRIETLADDIHSDVAQFAGRVGPLHFVTHSMGGLLARVYLARYRPSRLQRVVLLGTPNGGSEIADLLKNLTLYRAFYGPAGQQIGTQLDEFLTGLPSPDYALGIVAGNRTIDPVASFFILPRPNDGRVSVDSSKLKGMADHIVLKTSHSLMLSNRGVIDQTIAFLREGRFERPMTSSSRLHLHCEQRERRSNPAQKRTGLLR
jgi:pimeloyl-ACP methyl ester carboxylesterase